MNIREQVRDSFYRGLNTYGIVETVYLGKVTVRLGRTGKRMSNLIVVGDLPSVGDTVIIDYGTGSPPVARLIGGLL